ncbi:adenosine receptor A3-like [Tiliqua scincoides]|uniref:adenosine receptor A3-like n=1 Tax=Tiliqua scincoides TaxID=71010 RepID=UPI0034631A54
MLVLGTSDIIYIVFEVVIAVFAILGNILIIWVVSLNPAFQKNVFYFISSLAVADIAVGLVMPVAIVVNFEFWMPYNACLFMCCLLIFFTQASILSLLAIAIDRYLIVRLLTRYQIKNSQKKIYVALGTVWLLSLLVGFVPPFLWGTGRPANGSDVECKFITVMDMKYMVYVSFFVGTLIPLILMCLLYARIFWIIHTKLKQRSISLRGSKAFYRQQFKTAKSLTLVLFLFAVCWLPLCILNCILYFHPAIQPNKCIMYVGILLTHSNSVMNPIIYSFRIQKFRKTCIQILRTYILCTDSDHSVSPSTSEHT